MYNIISILILTEESAHKLDIHYRCLIISSSAKESSLKLDIHHRCLIMSSSAKESALELDTHCEFIPTKIRAIRSKESCWHFLNGGCRYGHNCNSPHFSTIEIDGICYASDLRLFKKFDTKSTISSYVNHSIRKTLSDHDAVAYNGIITWNTLSALGARQKESIMNYGGDWHGYPTGDIMSWDGARYTKIVDHIASGSDFTNSQIMCFQEMNYSIVQLLMNRLGSTHHFNFTESYHNSNTGGLLTIVRKDLYSIEEQINHRDRWIDRKSGSEASKLVGSLVTIRNKNDDSVLKIINVHLDVKSAKDSIPGLITSIVSNNVNYVIGDFNLRAQEINKLLKDTRFRIELISRGVDHICKIVKLV